MCIIVAKNSGVKMPEEIVLSNCFINNPDGAGIMVGYRGKVYGFKGLMTFDAFKSKLHQLNKRFGDLDKFPVVMHFRIMTHGSAIPENTHPFPVSSSYKALRKSEWVADLGMAHNGIISATSLHPDVKKENVSDTMVFVKRIVAPIAEKCSIMDNDKILDSLRLASGSKLAFLDGKRLRVLGDFVYQNGVYFSNRTFEEIAYVKPYSYSAWNWDDYDDTRYSSYWSKSKKRERKQRLSYDDEKFLRESEADEYGLILIGKSEIICKDFTYNTGDRFYAVDEEGKELFYWDEETYEWVESSFSDKFIDYIPEGWKDYEEVAD